MHTHHSPTVSRYATGDGDEITTVRFEDGCFIQFIAHEGARWNGYATEHRHSSGFLPADIDAARNLAFPERR